MIDNTYIPPHMSIHPELLSIISDIEDICGYEVEITSSYRSFEDHYRIYMDKARNRQYPFEDGVFDESKIPMGSDHLVKDNSNLVRGIDFVIRVNNNKFLPGKDIYDIIKRLLPDVSLFDVACGVGKTYLHLGWRKFNDHHAYWEYK